MRKVDTLRRAPEKRPPQKRTPRPGFSSWNVLRYRMLALLAIIGPGFITANVDNDPGGILTYSQAGAKYGYTLLWTLIPTTIALIVVQEMAARMGAITGKGLSDLIREEFGLRMTFFTMIVLGLADFGNIAAEFAGLASGMGVFGISKYIAVPLGAGLVWTVIVRGSYKPVERVLLILSMIYFAYPVSAILAHPDWKLALEQTIIPQFNSDPGYLVMIVGLIGTTITPWMQFYLQASVVEKGVSKRNYGLAAWTGYSAASSPTSSHSSSSWPAPPPFTIPSTARSPTLRKPPKRWRPSPANSPPSSSPSGWSMPR